MVETESELAPIDRHFAALVNRLASKPSRDLELAAKLVSSYRRQGHVCLPIKDVTAAELVGTGITAVPSTASWRDCLRTSGVVGEPGEFAPLILDGADRLYLQRYWKYEQGVAADLQSRLVTPRATFPQSDLGAALAKLFPGKTDDQKRAAFVAATSKLCVISGGPGTGKTRTIVAICALLLALDKNIRLALAAPTGKAATRLKDEMRQTQSSFPLTPEIAERLPTEASTIQRLLGARGDSPNFRHNAETPLAFDAVIIDEASMLDLALLAKLLDAVRPETRVVLVGDKDQLASVEAGSAFRDICTPGFKLGVSASQATAFESYTREKLSDTVPACAPIHDSIVELRRNYRFKPGEAIAELSSAINRGATGDVVALLKKGGQVSCRPTPSPKNLEGNLRENVMPHFESLLIATEPEVAINQIGAFAVLCALRRGPFGAEAVNALLEQMLRDSGTIDRDAHYYHGQPLVIVRNDYNVELFNGDLGVVLRDAQHDGELRVFFRGEQTRMRSFSPARLPAHEPAFALTVHKSQGSEFREALVILPDRDAPVLTRESLYTAVTRVRERVALWANDAILEQAISRRVRRSSGLRDILWGTATNH